MSELRTKIEELAKSTIGYSEAQNKESFMVGVSVAFHKTNEHYSNEVEQLKRQIDMYKSMYENLNEDMKTLTGIISRYSNSE
jgi:hypothetical protein